MTKREFAALACKVLGLYSFISALKLLPMILMPFSTAARAAMRWMLMVNALPGLLHILTGFILWFGADALAGRMIKDTGTAVSPVVVGKEAQVVAFSCLGLWSLLQVIPRIGQLVTNFFMISQQDAMLWHDYKGMTAPDIVAIVIQLALGLWLLFGAAGLTRLIGSLRNIGMDESSPQVTN